MYIHTHRCHHHHHHNVLCVPYFGFTACMHQVVRRFVSQLNKVGLSLIRNLGVVGGTAKVLSAIGTGVASLARDEQYSVQRQQLQRRRSIRGAGDGMLAGAESLAQGVVQGVAGVVTNPLQGVRRGGLQGVRNECNNVQSTCSHRIICAYA